MVPELIYFIVGIVLGFIAGVYVMFRRQSKRLKDALPQPSATQTAEITRDGSGDPMADVDRRMAGGAYDAAADIVIAQIAEDPANVRLKAKLLEIYFVWGSEEKYLTTFREHEAELRQSKYWAQVSTMGAQLCPNEPDFADS